MSYVARLTTRFAPAWGKGGDVELTPEMEAAALPVERIEKALKTRYTDYVHATAYYVVEGDFVTPDKVCYRLSKDSLRIEGFENAVRMGVVFVDLDRDPHVPWTSGDEALAAFSLIRELFPHAALYTTRRGMRLVFKLAHETDPVGWERAAASITNHVAEVLIQADVGMAVDKTTAEWTRLFQLPQVVREGEKTWEQPYFYIHVPEPWDPAGWAANPSAGTVVAATPLRGSDAPEVPEPRLIPPDEWEALTRDVAERLTRDAGIQGLISKLRTGVPFFEKGQRNSTTFKSLAAFLEAYYAEREQDPDALTVYSYFYESTKNTQGSTPPSEALDELWAMIHRMIEAKTWIKDEHHSPLPQKTVPTRYGSLPVLVYTGGSSRYLYDPTAQAYTEPMSNSSAVRATFTDIWGPRFGISHKATEVYVLQAFGTRVSEVVLDLAAQSPYLEDNGRRGKALVVPVGQRVTVDPVYHKDIQEWLEVLGGDDVDGLLSWLHWALKLEDPLCALFLCGAGGTGKSMIAQALATFYAGRFVSFDEAVARFNGRLAVSPIIWLDEGSKEANTSRFRELVGNSIHKIERKHVDPETLRGNVRVFISANREDALRLDDVRTVDDVNAITKRVRFIRVTEAAKRWLDRRGGRKLTEEWVLKNGRPGALCEHIAWLAENYKPASVGSRFRVEGKPTSWHYRAIYNGAVGIVLARIALALLNSAGQNAQRGRAPVGLLGKDTILIDTMEFMNVHKGALSAEGVDPSDVRQTLQAICIRGKLLHRDDREWNQIPAELIRDMPRIACPNEAVYRWIRDNLGEPANAD